MFDCLPRLPGTALIVITSGVTTPTKVVLSGFGLLVGFFTSGAILGSPLFWSEQSACDQRRNLGRPLFFWFLIFPQVCIFLVLPPLARKLLIKIQALAELCQRIHDGQ